MSISRDNTRFAHPDKETEMENCINALVVHGYDGRILDDILCKCKSLPPNHNININCEGMLGNIIVPEKSSTPVWYS